MKALSAAIVMTCLGTLAPASEPDGRGDVIKGIWATVSVTAGGVKQPDDPTGGPSLTAYDGTNYVQRKGLDVIEEGSYLVDPTKNPATIDFLVTKGPDAGKTQLGIYKLDGSTLKNWLRPGGPREATQGV